MPKKGVTELDRLAYFVNAVDSDCFSVPLGSFKLTPLKEVRKNEAFRGLKKDQAFKLESYLHFRKPLTKEKKDLNDRDDAIYNNAFLDDLSTDLPSGTWNILRDTTEQVVIVRSNLWPGFFTYHKVNTPAYGSVYIGTGVKNLDLPFLI